MPASVLSQGSPKATVQAQAHSQQWRQNSVTAVPSRGPIAQPSTPSYVPEPRVQGGSLHVPSVNASAGHRRGTSPPERRLDICSSLSRLGTADGQQAARSSREVQKRERSLEAVDVRVRSSVTNDRREHETQARRGPLLQAKSVSHTHQPGMTRRESKTSGSMLAQSSLTSLGPSEAANGLGSQQPTNSSASKSEYPSPQSASCSLEGNIGDRDIPPVRVHRRPSRESPGREQPDRAERDRALPRPQSTLSRPTQDRIRKSDSRAGPRPRSSPKKQNACSEILYAEARNLLDSFEDNFRSEKEPKLSLKDVGTRETDLSKLEGELATREVNLAKREEELKKMLKKIKEIELREAGIKERDSFLKEREQELKAKEMQQTRALVEKEQALKKETMEFNDDKEHRRSKHASKEEQLGERERRINEREALFQERTCEKRKEDTSLQHEKKWLATEKESLHIGMGKLQKDRDDFERDKQNMERDRDKLKRDRDQLTQERKSIANQRKEIDREVEEEKRRSNADIEGMQEEVLKREHKVAERESELRVAEASLSQRQKEIADREYQLNRLEAQRQAEFREREDELQKKESKWRGEEQKQHERQKQLDLREFNHANATKEASLANMTQAFFKPARVSPRNKENREIAQMLEDQRTKNQSIKKEPGSWVAEENSTNSQAGVQECEGRSPLHQEGCCGGGRSPNQSRSKRNSGADSATGVRQ